MKRLSGTVKTINFSSTRRDLEQFYFKVIKISPIKLLFFIYSIVNLVTPSYQNVKVEVKPTSSLNYQQQQYQQPPAYAESTTVAYQPQYPQQASAPVYQQQQYKQPQVYQPQYQQQIDAGSYGQQYPQQPGMQQNGQQLLITIAKISSF